ncbi:hypothetical protein AN641_08000 [Candidatus Epulonipiscioides gigas]|nr:hypothetical protein AN641_08000 [Epulopiscium sp. SCG-C07WGA-EpuloA2]
MDIKWTYVIIGILYIIIFLTKFLVNSINTNFKKLDNVMEVSVFKKDFLTIIAIYSFVGMIIITILTTIGDMPFNINAFVISILLVILSIISGFSKILILEDSYVLLGEKITQQNIKQIIIEDKKFKKVKIETNNSISYEFYPIKQEKNYFKPQ